MLRRSIRHLGLAAKLSLLVIGLAVASSGAIAWLILQQFKEGEQQRLRDRGRLLASFLAEATGPFAENPQGFQEFVDRFEPDLDIAYMCLAKIQGRTVACRALRGRIPQAQRDGTQSRPVEEFTNAGGELESIEFRAPIWAPSKELQRAVSEPRIVGYLHLGMGLDNLKQGQSEFVRSIALETLIVASLGSLASLLLVRRFTAPFKDLVRATERISQGDFDHSIPVRQGNEIGHLAGLFNRMLDHLRRYRDEILAQQQRLEEQVEQRSSQLKKAAQAAAAAAREAEEANRAKSRFLAAMSHELRTPLNSVLGMSELLQSSPLTKHQQRLVETVTASGQALLQVINSILDFSRIEASSLAFERSPIELRSLIDKALRAAKPGADAKGLVLCSVIDPQVPRRLIGDPGRLSQILNILLENAVKFSDDGQVEVRAACLSAQEGAKRDEEGSALLLEVEDQGIGIDKELQGKIFHSFSQADGSTRRRYGGTGLGLAIAKQLVEKMGGAIGVESCPSSGSRFWFSVPLHVERSPASEGQAPQIDIPPRRIEGREAQPSQSLDARVLLAEDNAANQHLVLETLKSFGCRVHLASDGQEAVEAFSLQDFDLVLMDCQMPVMDGYEATCLIRSMEQSQAHGSSTARRTPVIALTANAMEGDRQYCLATGMDDYIAKPFAGQQLYECLRRWIADPAAPRRNAGGARIEPEAANDTESALESAALNPQALEQILQLEARGADGLLQRLIQLFIQDAPPLLAKLDEAAQIGNLQDLREAAHSLKSMAANLGLVQLAGTAKAIENLARKGAPKGRIEKRMAALRIEYPAAERALLQCRGTPSNTVAAG